jgi:hypothetical protein
MSFGKSPHPEILNKQLRHYVEALLIFMEDVLYEDKYFLDILELELILIY